MGWWGQAHGPSPDQLLAPAASGFQSQFMLALAPFYRAQRLIKFKKGLAGFTSGRHVSTSLELKHITLT